jgi:hypothetical protein
MQQASINVSMPAGAVELCVQDGRPRGSCGLCCPAKPSFDHAKPASLPLTHGDWGQFQTKVQSAVAGMKSERALAYFAAVPCCLMFIAFPFFFFTAGPDDNHGSGQARRLDVDAEVIINRENLYTYGAWAVAIAWGVASLALAMWVSKHNQKQDELISGACAELTRASSGRLTVEYHTFFTSVFSRRMGRQPHRVIVIAPSQQAHASAEVVPGAPGALAQAVVVQPAQAAYAEEP